MKKFTKVIAGSLWALPFMAFAVEGVPSNADSLNSGYLSSLLTNVSKFLGQIVVVLIAFAVVWFIVNVIKYVMSTDEDSKKAARTQMIWGIIGIAVIVSIWGLVGILQATFGLSTTSANKTELIKIIPQ